VRVATAVLAAIITWAAPALSADLDDLLPPAPVIDDSDIPVDSGWYLRGSISAIQAADDAPAVTRLRFDGALSLGAGVGYQVMPWLRGDVTADHRFETDLLTGASALSSMAAPSAFRSTIVLANAYVDLPFWEAITPYFGGGLGFSRNEFDQFADAETAFAWALTAGVGFDLTRNLKFDLAYRYSQLDAATVQFDSFDHHLSAHEIRVGARYHFD
jgi:opacity protein-like surface antigen